MTDRDDDDLDLDLGAWDVPRAKPGFADRVITRLAVTDQAIGIQKQARMKRGLWIGGGAMTAAAAVVLVWSAVRTTTPAPLPPTNIVATKPRTVDIGYATADLDRGANIAVAHDRVTQSAGAANWHVRDRALSLDVAGVASIEASNATLRVEAHMNLTDAKLVGSAAVTAAVVSLVTVVVYEGHVKISGAGQTVIVNPGTSASIAPGAPPVIDTPDPVISGTPVTRPAPPAPPATPAPPTPPTVTPADRAATIAKYNKLVGLTDLDNMRPAFAHCALVSTVVLTFDVAADGSVTRATAVGDKGNGLACFEKVGAAQTFQGLTKAAKLSMEFVSCDELVNQGVTDESRGDHTAALDAFTKAVACKPDDHTMKLAFMASCNAGNVTAARKWWHAFSLDDRMHLQQICIHNHITPDMLDQ